MVEPLVSLGLSSRTLYVVGSNEFVQFGMSSFHCLVSLLPQCLASHLKILWKMFKHDVKLWGYRHFELIMKFDHRYF